MSSNMEILSRDSFAESCGGLQDYVSPSRLALWLKCPLAFKLRYVDGIRTPPTQNLFLGKRVHDGLEFYYRHRQAGATISVKEVAEHIDRHWGDAADEEQVLFKAATESEKLLVKCQDLVACYLNRFADSDEHVLGVELAMTTALADPFTGEVIPMPMVGVVDLLIETDAGAVLVDFKTAARGGEPIEQQYEIQLGCYAAMYRELFGLPEAGLEIRTLVKTKQPRIEVHRFESRSAQHFARLFAVLHEYVAALDRGQFNYRPGTGCMFCDMRHEHCKAWSGHLPQFQNMEDLAWPKSS